MSSIALDTLSIVVESVRGMLGRRSLGRAAVERREKGGAVGASRSLSGTTGQWGALLTQKSA